MISRLRVRLVLTAIAMIVWGYGQRMDRPEFRLGGMVLLALAILLRFAPKRWFGEESTDAS